MVDLEMHETSSRGNEEGGEGSSLVNTQQSRRRQKAETDEVALRALAVNDLRVARWLFWGGFALLPWLWFVVWLHFRKVAKQAHSLPGLAWYVRGSQIGAICGGAAFLGWFTRATIFWQTWEAGRNMMLFTPYTGDEL